MKVRKNIIVCLFMLLLMVQTAFSRDFEEIKIQDHLEKDLKEKENFLFYAKDLDLSQKEYLIIRTTSNDQASHGRIFLNQKEDPCQRNRSDIMAIEELKDNMLFLGRNLIGSKTTFYLEILCNGKCNVKLSFEYASEVPLKFGEDYQYISNPTKERHNAEKLKMTIPGDKFPALVYLISPNDDEIPESQVTIKKGSESATVRFTDFLGGKIAVIEDREYIQEEGEKTLEISLNTVPNAVVRIGARKHDNATNPRVEAGDKMVYSAITRRGYKECFNFYGEANETYQLNALPFRRNLKITYENGTVFPRSVDLDYQRTFVINFGEEQENMTLCFEPSEGANGTVYGFQYEKFKEYSSELNAFKEPLYHGVIYEFSSNNADAIYYRHYRKEYRATRATTKLNVDVRAGSVEVYSYKCLTYPNCSTADISLINPVHEVNGFFTGYLNIGGEQSVEGAEQNLLVVKCISYYCLYQVSFYADADTLELRPYARFSQFISGNITDDYKFMNEYEQTPKIMINLYPTSGDAFIQMIDEDPDLNYKYIYSGTNTIVEITRKEGALRNPLVGDFVFVIRCTRAAYYSVSYHVMRTDFDFSNFIPPGAYTLETISNKKGTVSNFMTMNRKKDEGLPFITTLFPVNCDITVKRGDKEILENDGIFQDFIEYEDKDYNNTIYNYTITLLNMEEQSTYDGERCMIYAAALESGSKIIMGEGQFLQFQLKKAFPEVTYLIPYTNTFRNMMSNFVIENEIPLHIEIRVEDHLLDKKDTKRNVPFLITPQMFRKYCGGGSPREDFFSVCNIEFTTRILNSQSIEDANRPVRFDFLARTENNCPSFFKKRLLREESVSSDRPYYFITDIGKGEEGEIILNYNKGSGVMAARIVPKDLKEDKPEWGGRYRLPEPYNTSSTNLYYDPYTQSIKYGKNVTENCTQGCDLLIGVFTTETFRSEYGIDINYFEDFSIFVRSTLSEDVLGGIVDIPANEFIQGHLEKLNPTTNKKDAYTLTIHNDCKDVLLEVQGDLIEVYINFDSKILPTKDQADYFCGEDADGPDFVCKISKFPNFRDHTLTIVVSSANKESAGDFNAYYLIKFRAPHKDMIKDVYELNSDQGVIANIDNGDMAYFLFPNRNYQIFNILYFYVEGEILSDFTMYANTFDADEFESSGYDELQKFLPTDQKAKYNTTNSFTKNFLVMDEQKMNEFVIVGVQSQKATTIRMLCTYKENILRTIPKPFATQIYKVETGTEEDDYSLTLTLPSDKDYEIFIQVCYGSMYVNANDEDEKQFILKGNGDGVIVGFSANPGEGIVTTVEIIATEDNSIFYVDYRPRLLDDAIEELKFGTTTEVAFDHIDFPANFYAKVPTNLQDKDFVVNIRYKGENNVFEVAVVDDFNLTAGIDNYAFIQKRLKDKTKRPNKMLQGVYSPFLRSGYVGLEDSYSQSNKANKYVFVDMNIAANSTKSFYEDVHLEIAILPLNDKNNICPGQVYNHYYLFGDNFNLHTIKRRAEIEDTMLFEFSALSPEVNFAFNYFNASTSQLKQNDTEILKFMNYTRVGGGKVILIFNFRNESDNYFPEKLLLSVFTTNDDIKKEDSVYTFRYTTAFEGVITNILLDEQTKYTYYKTQEMVVKSRQPCLLPQTPEDEELSIPSDYYIVMLPKEFNQTRQSIAIRRLDYVHIDYYDIEEFKKYIKYRIKAYPAESSDTLTVFAMADYLDDLFQYTVEKNVTGNPKEDSDIIELDMDLEDIEYKVEDNDDQKIYHFKINLLNYTALSDFVNVKVKSKNNITENDLYFSPTQPRPERKNAELMSDERLLDSIFVNKDYMKDSQVMYLSVYCDAVCDFEMKIINARGASIRTGENIRHLFRGEKNFHLPVYISERAQLPNEDDNEDKYISIYAFGGDEGFFVNLLYMPASNDTDDEDTEPTPQYLDMIKFYNGYVATFEYKKYPLENGAYFRVEVYAPSGLMNVGARIVNELNINKIAVFHNEIRGFLTDNTKKECFPIQGIPKEKDEVECTIITDTKLNVFLEEIDSDKKINGTEYTIEYQDSVVFPYDKDAKVCFERIPGIPGGISENGTGFGFQIIQNQNFRTIDSYKVASKINGVIYKQNLDDRKIIYYRHSKYRDLTKANQDNEENVHDDTIINYNLKIIEGTPLFFIHRCQTFPNCVYNENNLIRRPIQGLIRPQKVGDFYTGAINTTYEKHEQSNDQFLIIVFCYNSPIDCSFEISFFDEKDRMKLRLNDAFNQYMTKDDKDKFKFNMIDTKISEIQVKLFVVSGGAYINWGKKPDEVNAPKFLDVGCNQVITLNAAAGKMIGDYEFEVIADENSYYIVTVYPIHEDIDYFLPRETISLETFPPDKTKTIAFHHYFREGALKKWSAKFTSINCDVQLEVLDNQKQPNVTMECPDGFCHHEMGTEKDVHLYTEMVIRYRLTAHKIYGDDGENLCKFYVLTHEVDANNQIVFGTSAPFKLFFNEDFPTQTLIYPFSNIYDHVTMNLILEDESYLSINLTINGNPTGSGRWGTTTAMKTRAITAADIRRYCGRYEEVACIASFSLSARNKEEYATDEGFIADVTIQASSDTPTYLYRRKLRQEYIYKDEVQYFVTDVGDKETGTVQVHFNKGKGIIFGKVVRKGDREADPNYRGRVHLPELSEPGVLVMDKFTNQLRYNSTKHNCAGTHCELFIGVYDPQEYEADEKSKLYLNDFSIFVRADQSSNDTQTFGSVVDIPINQMIVGSLYGTRDKGIYDYYHFNVPIHTKEFTIELYTEAVDMFINRGNEFPNDTKSEYRFDTDGGPAFITIKPGNVTSLKGEEYMIAIGSDKIDQIVAARYMFRIIAIERDLGFNQEINSDDTIITQITDEKAEYAHYIMPVRSYDFYPEEGMVTDMYLYTYARKPLDFKIYVRFITEAEYATLTPKQLEENWPNPENAEASSETQYNTDYLYLGSNFFRRERLMLISVKAPKKELFYLTGTHRLRITKAMLIPFSTQVFDVDFNHKTELIYPDDHDYLLHLTCIAGTGTVFYRGIGYNLKGIHDSLIITINKNELQGDYKIELASANDEEGFDVMTEYNIRPELENFDEVRYGESGEMVIYDDDMPLIYYSKLYKAENVTFNFKFNKLRTIKDSDAEEVAYRLSVNGGVISYSDIIKKRNDPTYSFDSPLTFSGRFDKSGIGLLHLMEADVKAIISELNITNPYLYIKIEKNSDNKAVYKYLYTEFSFLPSNNIDIPVPVNQYTYNFMPMGNSVDIYRLKKQYKSDLQLTLQFSSSYPNVRFALQDEVPTGPFYKNATTIVDEHPSKRKDVVLINFNSDESFDSVYLCVFKKEFANDVNSLDHPQYAFKYQTGNALKPLEIPKKGYEVKHLIEKNELHVKVPQIAIFGDTYVTGRYTVKVIHDKNLKDGMIIDSIGPSSVEYDFLRTYDTQSGDKELHVDIDLGKFEFDKGQYRTVVVAYLNEFEEMISYGEVKLEEEGPGSSKKAVVIVVIIVLIILISVGGVFLYKYLDGKKQAELKDASVKTTFVDNKESIVPEEEGLTGPGVLN